jgi:hypothetical protein
MRLATFGMRFGSDVVLVVVDPAAFVLLLMRHPLLLAGGQLASIRFASRRSAGSTPANALMTTALAMSIRSADRCPWPKLHALDEPAADHRNRRSDAGRCSDAELPVHDEAQPNRQEPTRRDA